MSEGALNIEDPKALTQYLLESKRIRPDERVTIQPVRGGVSNRTVIVEHPPRRSWFLKQALPKLRVPVEWFSSPERIEREWLGLRMLRGLLGRKHIPAPVFFDKKNHFVAMHAIRRDAVSWKEQLMRGRVEDHCVQDFALLLSKLHIASWKQSDIWQEQLQDCSNFETLRLEPYYEYTATQVSEAASFLRQLAEETRTVHLTAVHGDYSPKNVIISCGNLILVDHEVLHWGDPAFDVSFAMTHLLSKAHHLRSFRQECRNAAQLFWRVYRHSVSSTPWFRGFEERAVRHLLACLLARVACRSVLEYLSPEERERQKAAVVALLRQGPQGIPEVIEKFLTQIAMQEESA